MQLIGAGIVAPMVLPCCLMQRFPMADRFIYVLIAFLTLFFFVFFLYMIAFSIASVVSFILFDVI